MTTHQLIERRAAALVLVTRCVTRGAASNSLTSAEVRLLRDALDLNVQRRAIHDHWMPALWSRQTGPVVILRAGLTPEVDSALVVRECIRTLLPRRPRDRRLRSLAPVLDLAAAVAADPDHVSEDTLDAYGVGVLKRTAFREAHKRVVRLVRRASAPAAMTGASTNATDAAVRAGRYARDIGLRAIGRRLLLAAARGGREREEWEGVSLAWSSLGWLYRNRGKFPVARALCRRGVAIARRYGAERALALGLHNLASCAFDVEDYGTANVAAQQAFAAYAAAGLDHTALMHDVASAWADQGYHARALPVLRAVASRLDDAHWKALAWANIARSASAIAHDALHRLAAEEAWAHFDAHPRSWAFARGCFLIGCAEGYAGRPDTERAIMLTALETAVARREHHVAHAAREWLRNRESPVAARGRSTPPQQPDVDAFAAVMANAA